MGSSMLPMVMGGMGAGSIMRTVLSAPTTAKLLAIPQVGVGNQFNFPPRVMEGTEVMAVG
jgi:hypothetical protein